MDVFSTGVLIGVVESLKPAPQFLLDTFFGRVQVEESEEIHFDVVSRNRRIAPFVSPLVPGKVQESRGFRTDTFKPAYVKPKTPFSPNRAIKRLAGEALGGVLSPQQRIDRLLKQDLGDHLDQINRRMEVMASEALRLARVTVTGEQYPTTVVNFGRQGDHTVVLGAGSKWTDAGVKPLNDLSTWSLRVLKTEGVQVRDVVMDVDTWLVFREDADVKERLDTRRVMENAMRLDGTFEEGGTYMGTVDGFNIWVYAGWYLDEAGVEQPIMPSGTVILSGRSLEGVRAFGAIQDHDAISGLPGLPPSGTGTVALPYFPKSWVDKDPSVRYLMTQSAPLVVPTRVNASLCATVL